MSGALCPPEGPLLEGSSALTLSQRLIFRGCNELWKDKNAQRRWCFHRSVANESRLLVNPGSENTARPSPAGPTGPRLPSPPPTRRSLLRVPSPPAAPAVLSSSAQLPLPCIFSVCFRPLSPSFLPLLVISRFGPFKHPQQASLSL